jgi:L,D-transpeptidase YbiS
MKVLLTFLRYTAGIGVALVFLAVLAAAGFAGYYYLPVLQPLCRNEWALRLAEPARLQAEAARLREEIPRLRKEGQALRQEAVAALPSETHIAIDTNSNVILVWENGLLLRQGICSTGMRKEFVYGKKRFFFETPKGIREVLKKKESPVWSMPDWAFYEEGKEPPPHDSPERLDDVTLGAYALSLGDGYLIHGTIYKRNMGKSVTHGCVRLDDGDLEFVFNAAQVGTKVYIF